MKRPFPWKLAMAIVAALFLIRIIRGCRGGKSCDDKWDDVMSARRQAVAIDDVNASRRFMHAVRDYCNSCASDSSECFGKIVVDAMLA